MEPVLWMDARGNTITPKKKAEAARLGLDRSGYSVPLGVMLQDAGGKYAVIGTVESEEAA